MVDWNAVLAGRTDGFSTAVGGARVGDGVAAIPIDDATRLEPSTPSLRRSWGSDGVFDVTEEGRRIAVPRETLIAELGQYGGRAYVDLVTYQVASGKIERIWVRGAPLAGLPFAAEADIERVLGASLGVEKKHGWVVHHFPERGISVAWDTRKSRVEHVALGRVEWRPPAFGAPDVLREWLAAASAGLAPEWKEPADRSSARWVRYARVTALLRAFGLGLPQSFAEGKFLEGLPLTAYPLAAAALATGPWRPFDREVSTYRDALGRLFWWLLVYRMEADRLLSINSGWLEAGHPGILTAIHLTGHANEGVAEALEDVDALLRELISPDDRRVPERELITRWGWPDVDLDELLREEW